MIPTLKLCKNCGEPLSLLAQLNVVRPWMWSGICSILTNDVPGVQCPRCHSPLDLPSLTLLVLPALNKCLIAAGATADPGLLQAIKQELENGNNNECVIECHETLAGFAPAISEHVLAYKPLLKELSKAQQEGNLAHFAHEHWRQLTPSALAAGVVGLTGLINGIGGYAKDATTGNTLSFERSMEIFCDLFGHIQGSVWVNLATSCVSEKQSLEKALTAHLVDEGFFPGSIIFFKSFIDDMRQKKDFPAQCWYACQALYASASAMAKQPNVFADEWAEIYYAFELAALDGGKQKQSLAQLRISNKRAASTIPEKSAWDAVSRRLSVRSKQRTLKQMRGISSGLGYNDLVDRVLGSLRFSVNSEDPIADVRRYIEGLAKMGQQFSPVAALRPLTKWLVEHDDGILVDETIHLVSTLIRRNHEDEAELDAWYGQCMKLLHRPNRFIERVGELPRDWEQTLSLERKLDLWNERANALRLMGHSDRALAITNALLSEAGNKVEYGSQRYVLHRNRAILLRDTGAFDESYNAFKELLDTCLLEDRAELLHSFSVTCALIGHGNEATQVLREALSLCQKNNGTQRAILLSSLGNAYACIGKWDDALCTLEEIDITGAAWEVAASQAACFTSLLLQGAQIDMKGRGRLSQCIKKIMMHIKAAEKDGDIAALLMDYSLLGTLMYQLDPNKSEAIWRKECATLLKLGRMPSSVAVARLASISYRRGEYEEVRKLLPVLPKAIAETLRGISDISLACEATDSWRAALHDLVESAIGSNAPMSDIRLFAELARDAIGRCLLSRRRKAQRIDIPLLEHGIRDDDLMRIAPGLGRIGVLEWVELSGGGLLTVLTTVGRKSGVQTVMLARPPVDLFNLRDRIRQRLNVWHAGRSGDPFDLCEWRALETWLHHAIGTHLDAGDHVIIFEHGELTGMPWHAALTPKWRCSYATGWSAVLSCAAFSFSSPLRVGLLAAPRFNDGSKVKDAFCTVADETRLWAGSNGHVFSLYENETADRDAFHHLMSECDIVALLCHGHVEPLDHEVALLVAADGRLAPMYVQSTVDSVDRHRLSWRDMYKFDRTPPLVITGACSTGMQWQAGAGEQMGLYGALRMGGTRALIGPRWDVQAEVIAPLVRGVLLGHVGQGLPLIDAVYGTCVMLEKTMPRWLAWSFSLEGDWM